MGIADDDIDKIRSTVSIVDVVGGYVALKRVGRNWSGLCPFHAEKSPSFYVRHRTGHVMTRCVNDVQNVQGLTGPVFLYLVETGVLVLFAAGIVA